jgi:hypothetical protein
MSIFFLGKECRNIIKKIEAQQHQIEIISSVLTEQSRLIVSLSIVQSDISKTISSQEIDDSERDYFTIRIPMCDDEVLN